MPRYPPLSSEYGHILAVDFRFKSSKPFEVVLPSLGSRGTPRVSQNQDDFWATTTCCEEPPPCPS